MKFARYVRSAALVLVMLGVAPHAMGQAPAEKAKVEGFRSAKFQMSEEQVRQAINKDFKIAGAKIERDADNPNKAPVLRINVPNLLPDRGTAQVNYTFGFKSGKLIQVDVVWSSALDSATTSEQMMATLANLRQYWGERGFAKNKTIVNAATDRPNVVVFFRGEDDLGRVVALVGRFKIDPKAEAGKQVLGDQPEAVILTYALNPKAPDIYRIEPGKF
ncbi:MAG: hypothetical protein AB7G15_15435 [Alphaproteobacteria bacterium]